MGMWKTIRKNYRRLMASLLTLAMVVTNAGGGLGTIFAAGETENALFLLDGEELREAIREAREQGESFDFSELHLAAGRKSVRTRYEKLLGKREGAVYALNLEIDDSYAPEGTGLQVFYNEAIGDVIFLFLNGSDLVVDYRVNIDGYETKPVRVNPNTANMEADGEEAPSFAENYEAADMIDDEAKKLEAEVLNPEETSGAAKGEAGTGEEQKAGDNFGIETGDVVKEPESQTEDAFQEETEESREAAETEGTTVPEKENGTGVKEAESGKPEEEDSESAPEDIGETGAEEEEETETENEEAERELSDEKDSDARDGELLGISCHEAALVAVSVDELEGGMTESEEEAESSEEEAAETQEESGTDTEEAGAETEPEGKEDENTAETDTGNQAVESEAGAEVGSEAESRPEESEAGSEAESRPEENEAGAEAESRPEGSEAETEAESRPEESEAATEAESKPDSSAETAPDPDADIKVDQPEMDGQLLEDDDIEILGELKGKEYDTVTILDHVNAKAWKIALEDIETMIGSGADDYLVDYQVNFPDAATIKGAAHVSDGEDLYFAVEPEEGYEIAAVYVNGKEAEAVEDTSDLASASDWKGYPHVYVAESVEEDLWIEIELEELDPILAAATYTAETADAVFTVEVPDGAFEEEVALEVSRITEEDILKELTEQASVALKENQIVAGVLAYDVAFISRESGEETEPQQSVEVSIRYKKTVVPDVVDGTAVTGISVVHLPGDQEAEVVAAAKSAEETEFAFRADSFSPFVVTIQVDAEARTGENNWATLEEAVKNVKDGETIYLLADVEVPYLMVNRESAKSFTLDLNGKTIRGTTTNYVLYLYGGKLTIEDSSEEKTGAITHKSGVKGGGVVINGGILCMENGMICGNESETGGGIKVNANGLFIMNGGSVKENRATSGGGLYVLGKAEINGNSSIEENTCANYGGGVYVNTGAEITMENGHIDRNENTSWYGGGVYNKGTFVMTGGTIAGNHTQTSTRYGGGIYNASGSLEIRDSKIEGNSNGGIYIADGDASLERTWILRNKGDQPALYVSGNGDFSADGCTINENKVEANVVWINRGIASAEGKRTFRQCTISDNDSLKDSYSNGSIVCLDGDASFESCEILNNTTISSGGIGVVDCGVSKLTMSDTRIAGNEAKGAGSVGGIKQRSSQGEITLINTVITDNKAMGSETSCGGVYVTTGKFILSEGSAVYNNMSKNGLGDFRFDKRAEWTLIKASEMKDPVLAEERYFSDYHYVWLGGAAGKEPVTFLNSVASGDSNVQDVQGKNDIFFRAIPDADSQPAGVYISGSGDDASDGASPESAVQTLDRALEALKAYNEGKEDSEKSNTIYVTGSITVNSAVEWDGHGVVLEREPSAPFTKAMVEVEKEGSLILRNITLDGGALKGLQSYGLVKVRNGRLELKDGAVLQNSSKNLGNRFEGGGAVYLSGGTLTMNEGSRIINNSSHNGGGVSVMDDGHFIMNGGEISGNTTDRGGDFSGRGYYTSGGGVFIAYNGKMEMYGGSISENISYDGGGISLGGPENDVFFKNGNPTFTMYGGRIDSNESYSNGGGIFVQMNCVATIYGGDITNNHNLAYMMGANFGGGGVYVNGGKSASLKNGLLQLYNVEISGNQGNTDKGNGAAIAGCPTSRTRIYLTDGGVIHENGGSNDIYLMSGNLAGGYSGIADLVISPFMLGGGAYHWTDAQGNELPLDNGFIQVKDHVFYARTAVSGDEVTGIEQVKTHINGNISGGSYGGPGAAIGSNGDVIIGSAPKEEVELAVEKIWNDAGYEKYRPASVDVRILQSTDGESYEDIGFVRLSQEDGWKTTLKNLPKSDGEGNDFIYNVREVPNGYGNAVTKDSSIDNDGKVSFRFTVTNTPTYALTLKKEVEGQASGKEFTFKISLNQADGSRFSGNIETVRSEGETKTLSFENGEASVTLQKDETIQLQNLEPGMAYKIEETDNGGAKETSVTIDGEAVETAEGTVELGGNINIVVFTNTFEEEKPAAGTLTIQKIVEGTAGETERDFRFQITLNDNSVSGEISGLRFEGGISEEFILKHGQSRTISDLPVGMGYTAEEIGSEELAAEGYVISMREDGKDAVIAGGRITGTIGAGDTINIICTNKKDQPDNPPPTPHRPGGGGGGNPGGPSGGGNPPGGPGTTTIEEPGVPLAALPPETVTELIEEGEAPLAALPKTGDTRHTRTLMMMLGIAGFGMLFAAVRIRRRKDESDD